MDKVLVNRLAKVELFCHTTNGKVDLLIHIYFYKPCENPNGMTLKNEKMIISPFESSFWMTLLLTILNS